MNAAKWSVLLNFHFTHSQHTHTVVTGRWLPACHYDWSATTLIVQCQYTRHSNNLHESGRSIFHCCRIATLEQLASPPTWFWTYLTGVLPAVEDAPVYSWRLPRLVTVVVFRACYICTCLLSYLLIPFCGIFDFSSLFVCNLWTIQSFLYSLWYFSLLPSARGQHNQAYPDALVHIGAENPVVLGALQSC